VAPAIQLDAEVVTMGWKKVLQNGRQTPVWVVPSNAAGWHINSAPAGQPGNTVISGHNNVEGEVFRYVSELEVGDTITLYAGDDGYTYTVQEKHLLKEAGEPASVRRQNAEWIAPTDDVRLTLVTCWPYSWPGNTHRVIVVARP
jgi:sortase A